MKKTAITYTAAARALFYLKDRVNNTKSGNRLPGIRVLAEASGLSVPTIQKAVHILAREGVLTSIRGKGLYAGNGPPVFPLEQNTSSSLPDREIFQLLQREITEGVFSTRQYMPTKKELQNKYGAGYKLLNQALARLVREHYLEKLHNKYIISRVSIKSTMRTVTFVVHENLIKPYIIDYQLIEFLRTIELECAKRQLFFNLLPINTNTNLIKYNMLHEDTLIYVFWPCFLEPYYTDTNFLNLVQSGVHIHIPDMNVDLDIHQVVSQHKNVFVYVMSGKGAAANVARFLLSYGHKHLAYISDRHSYNFSTERLECLERTIKQYYPEASVLPVTSDIFNKRVKDLDNEASDSGGPVIKTRNKQYRKILYETYKNIKLSKLIAKKMNAQLYSALKHKEITAWVAANDEVMLLCNNFLVARNISVTRQISLIGFDDLEACTINGLTSYNLNFGNAAIKILNSIGQSPQHIGDSKNLVKVEGYIAVRSSVKRLPVGK